MLDRRRFVACLSSLGISSTLFPNILWASLQEQQESEAALRITKEMIREAEKLAGLEFSEEERELMLKGVNEHLEYYEKLRTVPLDNSVAPALQFDPRLPAMSFDRRAGSFSLQATDAPEAPANLEELAFWPVTQLAQLIQSRKVSSLELTEMYLARIKKYDPQLLCVVSLTEDLALRQARRADEEIASGRYRGPLHGIPWGAKDLLATRDYKTTWGAIPYKDQIIDADATVVQRLEEAGAVLVAKLTLGALAWGDVWYGGKTRNPWDPKKGSSGSSAGPAAATAAGLVGFSIGSETWGSIVSPSTACGVTSLRPTFGRVSRFGAMALSWSMDKLGPMGRTVEDCALVFNAIYGPDGKDSTVVDLPFSWPPRRRLEDLRIGYLRSAFEEDPEDQDSDDKERKELDQAALEKLRSLGFNLIPIEVPDYPVEALSFILNVEAAAAFDDLTRSNRDDLLVRQIENAWPNVFRQSRLIPAVEYIQANRIRTLVMQAMSELMSRVDVYVAPSFGGDNLLLTNLTGHPCVVLPNGFTSKGLPTSVSFIGNLYAEAETLALARTYQDAGDFHQRHPPSFAGL
ncbi:MAG: amidase family protein [Acidobacteriota bacterium]